jgi:hypothetical protein
MSFTPSPALKDASNLLHLLLRKNIDTSLQELLAHIPVLNIKPWVCSLVFITLMRYRCEKVHHMLSISELHCGPQDMCFDRLTSRMQDFLCMRHNARDCDSFCLKYNILKALPEGAMLCCSSILMFL